MAGPEAQANARVAPAVRVLPWYLEPVSHSSRARPVCPLLGALPNGTFCTRDSEEASRGIVDVIVKNRMDTGILAERVSPVKWLRRSRNAVHQLFFRPPFPLSTASLLPSAAVAQRARSSSPLYASNSHPTLPPKAGAVHGHWGALQRTDSTLKSFRALLARYFVLALTRNSCAFKEAQRVAETDE